MALERLDAVVIGASIEGLVAAALLAKAGRAVTVVERQSASVPLGAGQDGVISVATARALNLTEFGLRFVAPPPVVGISGGRALVLWPDAHAARASVAAFSARDAEAIDAFHARIARAASGAGSQSVISWLTSGAAASDDPMSFRVSSLARILDETFDNDLLKGVWAQGAISGTGASPAAPGSGVLLARSWMLAAASPESGFRFVAGGQTRLRQVLLDQLRHYNNADVRFSTEASEIAAERDVIQAVTLSDGSVIRTPLVISSLAPDRNREMLTGFRRPPPSSTATRINVSPAQIKLTLGALPEFPGLDAATLTSGAIVRLDPSIARLTRAHGAFSERTLAPEPCLDMRLAPRASTDGKQRWDMFVAMTYLPLVTVEGPWAGNRRDRLRTLCVRAINGLAPSFGASIEAADILHPGESETVMDPKGVAALNAMAALDLTGVPESRAASADQLVKGLTVLDASIYGSEGDAGILAARAVLGGRAKAGIDA
ncbi:MAG: NAD(P)-binding protein [Micropepsaceae bacterium]